MTNNTNNTSTTAIKPAAAATPLKAPVKKVAPAKNTQVTSKTSASAKPAPVKASPVKTTIANPAKEPINKAVKPKKSADKNKTDKRKTDKVKSEKVKMARDSFTMPKDEYAQLDVLKARMSGLGKPVKKSELLRAGIKLLTGLSDPNLQALMASVPVIKTGRPKKK